MTMVVLLTLAVSLFGISLSSANDVQYIYDSLNRLIEVRYPDKVIHYTYDAAGNRTGVTVENLVTSPSINSILPGIARTGGNGFNLKVTGTNFVDGSVVQWNGENRVTTFVSVTELRAVIPASDIATSGIVSVTVLNPAQANSVSNSKTFSINDNVVVYSMSGRTTTNGNSLNNVTVALSGTQTANISTDTNGNFSFASLPEGEYTLTPTRTNYVFTPTNRNVTYPGGGQTGLDFTAVLATYTITGRVTNGSNGLSGVAITLGGSQTGSTTTNSNGDYSINATAEGNYTITPSLAGYSFNPPSQNFDNLSGNQTGNFTATTLRRTPFDFDGDGKSDISIFRPSNAEWWINRSSDGNTNAYQFGSPTDEPVPADYDGDGKTDIAFWRPSTGEWFVLRSSDLTFFAAPFGNATDIPAPGDFDGDNKADLAVFRPSQGTWFINKTTGGVQITQFGINGDQPVVSDYDGDGKADIAIFRPMGGSGSGEWWMNRSTAGLFATPFGSSTDKTVPGDYTGDGKADIAFWRPSTGEWFVLRSENLTFYSAPFGANGDIPAPGDYDGDGKFDFAVFRPSNATWYILRSTQGALILGFGTNGDLPTAASYVR